MKNVTSSYKYLAESAGAVEYTDYTSTERWDYPKEYPGYNTKQCHSKAPVI